MNEEVGNAMSPTEVVAKSAERLADMWSATALTISEAAKAISEICRQITEYWEWETALKAAEAANSPLAWRYHGTKKKRTRKKYAKKIMEWYRGD